MFKETDMGGRKFISGFKACRSRSTLLCVLRCYEWISLNFRWWWIQQTIDYSNSVWYLPVHGARPRNLLISGSLQLDNGRRDQAGGGLPGAEEYWWFLRFWENSQGSGNTNWQIGKIMQENQPEISSIKIFIEHCCQVRRHHHLGGEDLGKSSWILQTTESWQ